MGDDRDALVAQTCCGLVSAGAEKSCVAGAVGMWVSMGQL